MTIKAPAGPPICHPRAGQGGDQEAGDDGGKNAGFGHTPEAMAKAIASGKATTPT